MLYLSRKIGESIYIGNDIGIVLKDIRKGQAKIGISAPQSIRILRGELFKGFNNPPKINNELLNSLLFNRPTFSSMNNEEYFDSLNLPEEAKERLSYMFKGE